MWYAHRKKIVAALVAGVVLAAIAAYLMLAAGHHDDISQQERAWLHRSPEPVVTVGTARQPALLPGASVAPTVRLQAYGPCRTALDMARSVMTEYPSGLALDRAGSTRLNKAFTAIDASCPADIAANFRSQEMNVWNNMAVPVTAGPAPDGGS